MELDTDVTAASFGNEELYEDLVGLMMDMYVTKWYHHTCGEEELVENVMRHVDHGGLIFAMECAADTNQPR